MAPSLIARRALWLAVVATLLRYSLAESGRYSFALLGEGVTPIGDPSAVGGGIIFDCKVTCQRGTCPRGSAREYERLGRCTTVHVEPLKGAWMSCSVESYFPAGSVLMEVRCVAVQACVQGAKRRAAARCIPVRPASDSNGCPNQPFIVALLVRPPPLPAGRARTSSRTGSSLARPQSRAAPAPTWGRTGRRASEWTAPRSPPPAAAP